MQELLSGLEQQVLLVILLSLKQRLAEELLFGLVLVPKLKFGLELLEQVAKWFTFMEQRLEVLDK